MKLGSFLREVSEALESRGIENGALDAEVFVSHFGGIARHKIKTEPDMELPGPLVEVLQEAVKRRLNFEPVAYIIGHREFYSLDFKVNASVLIPRPETELLVDMAIYWASYGQSLLDLCTGSGVVAVSVKKNRDDLEVSASDISPQALEVARENSGTLLGEGKVNFFQGDLFEPFEGEKFHVITANPPYIDPGERESLEKDLAFEPDLALFCDRGGRDVIGRIVESAPEFLHDGGVLLLEIGHDQRDFVSDLGRSFNYEVSVLNDYSGLPRVATLRKE